VSEDRFEKRHVSLESAALNISFLVHPLISFPDY